MDGKYNTFVVMGQMNAESIANGHDGLLDYAHPDVHQVSQSLTDHYQKIVLAKEPLLTKTSIGGQNTVGFALSFAKNLRLWSPEMRDILLFPLADRSKGVEDWSNDDIDAEAIKIRTIINDPHLAEGQVHTIRNVIWVIGEKEVVSYQDDTREVKEIATKIFEKIIGFLHRMREINGEESIFVPVTLVIPPKTYFDANGGIDNKFWQVVEALDAATEFTIVNVSGSFESGTEPKLFSAQAMRDIGEVVCRRYYLIDRFATGYTFDPEKLPHGIEITPKKLGDRHIRLEIDWGNVDKTHITRFYYKLSNLDVNGGNNNIDSHTWNSAPPNDYIEWGDDQSSNPLTRGANYRCFIEIDHDGKTDEFAPEFTA